MTLYLCHEAITMMNVVDEEDCMLVIALQVEPHDTDIIKLLT